LTSNPPSINIFALATETEFVRCELSSRKGKFSAAGSSCTPPTGFNPKDSNVARERYAVRRLGLQPESEWDRDTVTFHAICTWVSQRRARIVQGEPLLRGLAGKRLALDPGTDEHVR
jgi:hypothetical protein